MYYESNDLPNPCPQKVDQKVLLSCFLSPQVYSD